MVASSLGDGETASADVAPGSYTVTEAVEEGWTLSDLSCDDTDSTVDKPSATATYEIAAGETVTCVFTNTEALVLGEVIDRDEDPAKPEEPRDRVKAAVKPASVLPFTGSDPSGLLALASLLMLTGGVAVLAGRRPEEAEAEPLA